MVRKARILVKGLVSGDGRNAIVIYQGYLGDEMISQVIVDDTDSERKRAVAECTARAKDRLTQRGIPYCKDATVKALGEPNPPDYHPYHHHYD